MDEIDGIRLMLEEARELLLEHFEENSRSNDKVSERLERLERLEILVRTGANPGETQDLRQEISMEHIKRALRKELVEQQKLYEQHSKNADRLKLRIAKFDRLEDHNKLDDAEYEMARLGESIQRIRQELA